MSSGSWAMEESCCHVTQQWRITVWLEEGLQWVGEVVLELQRRALPPPHPRCIKGILSSVCSSWNLRAVEKKSWCDLAYPVNEQVRDIFNSAAKVVVGNGKRIFFWTNNFFRNELVLHVVLHAEFSLLTMINKLGDFVTYGCFWIIVCGYKLRVISDCFGRLWRWTENVRFPIWDFDIHEWVRVVLLGWL
jgi:hypothetical protein